MADTGMRLSTGMKVFLGIDVILVATFLVLLVVGLGGSDDEKPQANESATSVGQVAPEPNADAVEADPVSFTLPSGNIACDMTVDGVTCSIASAGFAPTAECSDAQEQVFVVDATGVSEPCAESPDRSAANAGAELEYGSVETVGAYTCTSATDGVTCVGASGEGFRLARSAFVKVP